jgi:hypothetical protein
VTSPSFDESRSSTLDATDVRGTVVNVDATQSPRLACVNGDDESAARDRDR